MASGEVQQEIRPWIPTVRYFGPPSESAESAGSGISACLGGSENSKSRSGRGLTGEEIRALRQPSFLNLKFTVSVCMGEKWDRPYSRSKAAA